MRVKQMAQQLGVTADTIRFYTRNGILSPQKNQINGYRKYGEKDIQRMRFIISARQLGFSVNDIKDILVEADNHHSPCPTVRRIIKERLEETENQFNEMVKLRQRMDHAIRDWEHKPDSMPDGKTICALIEEFNED